MKKIIWLLAILITVSCNTEDKEYVTLKGKLKTNDIEKITIQGRNFSKDIAVSSDGSFSDTLKITNGVHAIVNGNDRITLFLKNGYNLNLEFKGEKFSEGIFCNVPNAKTDTACYVLR